MQKKINRSKTHTLCLFICKLFGFLIPHCEFCYKWIPDTFFSQKFHVVVKCKYFSGQIRHHIGIFCTEMKKTGFKLSGILYITLVPVQYYNNNNNICFCVPRTIMIVLNAHDGLQLHFFKNLSALF